ncbi:MAG: 30S ribosomal protein S1 [Bacillota bacterium]
MTEEKMENVMEEVEESISEIKKGDIINGEVISVNDKEAILDINYSSEGILNKSEITTDNSDPSEVLNEGEKIKVVVLKEEDEDGNVILSKVKADKKIAKEEIKAAFENDSNLLVKVIKEVKGGVLAVYKDVKLFIPASLISAKYIEDLGQFVDQELEVRIEELDFDNNRIIGSRKAIESEELDAKKEEILNTLSKDDVVKGTVTRLADFGAFVDLGGIDGLIHISQMSYQRIDHPSEVLKSGDKVNVKVLKVDKERERVSLKLDKFDDNPWNNVEKNYKTGDVVKGLVKRITDFGAFVELEKGIEGLVHISQISDQHVENVEDELEVGQEIDVKILNVKKDRERIGLSIKDTVDETAYQNEDTEDDLTLGDKFADKFDGLKFD